MRSFRRFLAVLFVGAFASVAAADRDRDDRSSTKSVRGEVTEVRAGDNQFALRTRDGKELKLDMDKDVKIRIDGKTTELGGLKQGMRVLVRYEVKDGKNRVTSLRTTLASSPTLRDEVRDLLREAKDLAFRQKDRFEERMREAQDKAEDRIDELQDRAEKADGKARERLQDAVKDLRKKQEKLREKLEKARSAKSETWDDAKSEVRSALEELQGALQRAASADNR
jgi:TolA-binding protein